MIFENTLSLKKLLTCRIVCHYMLLTPSQLIVSRLIGVVLTVSILLRPLNATLIEFIVIL